MAFAGPSVIGLTGGTGLLSPYLEVTGWLHVFGVNDPAKFSVADSTGTLDFWVDTTTGTTNVTGELKVNGAVITPFDPTQPLLLHGPGQMFTVANADLSNEVFFVNTDTSLVTSTGSTVLTGTNYTNKFNVKTLGGTTLFNIDSTTSVLTIGGSVTVPAFGAGFVLSNSGGNLSSSATVPFGTTFSSTVVGNALVIANASLLVNDHLSSPLFDVDSTGRTVTNYGTLVLSGSGQGFALVNSLSQVSSSQNVTFDTTISGADSLTKFQVKDNLGTLIFGVDTLTPEVSIYGTVIIPGLTANAIVQTNSSGGLFASSFIAASSVGRSTPVVVENSNATVGTVALGFLCQSTQQGYLEFTPTNFNLSNRLQVVNTYASGVDHTLQLTNSSIVGGTGVSVYATVNSGGSATNGTLSFLSTGWSFDTPVTVANTFTQTGGGAISLSGPTALTVTSSNALLIKNASLTTMLQLDTSLPLLTVGCPATFSGSTIFNSLATFNTGVSVNSTALIRVTSSTAFVVETNTPTTVFTVDTSGLAVSVNNTATFNVGTGNATFNGNIAQNNATTFSTGTGNITLNGNVTQTGSKTFTTGTGAVSINGTTTAVQPVTIAITNAAALAVTTTGSSNVFSVDTSGTNCNFAANIVQTGSKTISTGTGLATFNGNITQSGSGTFTTGTGAVTIQGATNVNATLWVNITSNKALQISDGSSNVSFNVDTSTATATFNTNIVQTSTSTLTTGTGAVTLAGPTTCTNTSTVRYTNTSAFAVTDSGGGVSFSVDTSGANIAINATTLVTDKAFIIQNNFTKGFYVNDHTGNTTIFNVDTVSDKITVQGIYSQLGTSTTAMVVANSGGTATLTVNTSAATSTTTVTIAGGISQTGTSNNSFAGTLLTSRNIGWSGQTSFDTNQSMQSPNLVNTQAKCPAWNTYSNRRLKQNIVPLDGAVDLLKQLNPVKFWWIEGQFDNVEGSTPIEHQGFIAEELYPILPHTCTYCPVTDDVTGVDYSKVVPVLCAALQNAISRIEALEAKNV